MVEYKVDCKSSSSKKLLEEEQDKWDKLIFKLGLEDIWYRDDFINFGSQIFMDK